MKKFVLLAILLLLFTMSFSETMPINSFDIGAKLAKIENKDFIVMFSSTSCPYCTKFIKESYPNTTVQNLLMNNYVFIEMNEKSPMAHFQGKEISYGQLLQGFGIRGTPSFVFFTSNSTPITILPGYTPADVFSKVLRYIAERLYEKKIAFKDYMEKKDNYMGKQHITTISPENTAFMLKYDVYSKKISNIEGASNKFLHYIVYSKSLANELLKKGFFNIFLVK